MTDSPPASPRSFHVRMVWLVTVAVALLMGSFAFWDPFDIDDRANIQQSTRHLAMSIRADLSAYIRARMLAQRRLAMLWSTHDHSSPQALEPSSRLFLEDDPGGVLIEWVDREHGIRWAVAQGGLDARGELDAIAEAPWRQVIEAGFRGPDGTALVSPAFELADGRKVASIVVPIVAAGAPVGLLVSIFDTRAALHSILEDHRELDHSVVVTQGDTEIYRLTDIAGEPDPKWTQLVELKLPGVTWHVRVSPNPGTVARMRSSLPEVIVMLSGLLGFIALVTVHFARAANSTSRELRQAHDELEHRVKERTLELQQTNQTLQGEIGDRMKAEESLQKLSGRLLQLQDEERRHIARELHDSTAQTLSAVAINVEQARRLPEARENGALNSLLRESARYIEDVLLEIRTISHLLHPPMLDELGLDVLRCHVEGFTRRSGIAVALNIQPDLGRLPRDVELALFRITQEALTNIHRHSGSRTARISLSRSTEQVTLVIADDGCGMPAGCLELSVAGVAKLGVGIAGMRERVRQLGGHLEITGGNQGTVLRTVLPLPR